jgi:hypothetical protein
MSSPEKLPVALSNNVCGSSAIGGLEKLATVTGMSKHPGAILNVAVAWVPDGLMTNVLPDPSAPLSKIAALPSGQTAVTAMALPGMNTCRQKTKITSADKLLGLNMKFSKLKYCKSNLHQTNDRATGWI